jgi:3-phosphoshikimate 1-carboxyvinyltransferase
MDYLEIKPLTASPHATIRVPGSKSITNRALVLAALSSDRRAELNPGELDICELHGVLQSEDTEVMIESLRRLGFQIHSRWNGQDHVVALKSSFPAFLGIRRDADLFAANSGTTIRFLAAMVSIGLGRFRLDGVPRMRERPIQDLLDALNQLGVRARSEGSNGCPPVIIETGGWNKNHVRARADVSSQFLSALLLAAPFAKDEMLIETEEPLVSEPYVAMTIALLRAWDVATVDEKAGPSYLVRATSRPGLRAYRIEPDASSASYFWAAAAITGGEVRVEDITTNSIQGDVRFVELLEDMGCNLVRGASGFTVHGHPLRGIDIDMNDISDTVMTLAAVACFAEGPTTIRNVAHIRHKETDRLTALATELRRVGAEVEEFADGLKITPRPLHGAEIETYNDHRMAMSMALIGLKVPGIVIKNPDCVGKTYPRFWEDLEKLRIPCLSLD